MSCFCNLASASQMCRSVLKIQSPERRIGEASQPAQDGSRIAIAYQAVLAPKHSGLSSITFKIG